MGQTGVCVLIPAYKPDGRLNELIEQLFETGFREIVVVDDGGGKAFSGYFEKAAEQGAKVLTHEVNRGKGAALKTGLKYIDEHLHMPVVTADADGQHSPKDIARIARRLEELPEALILGTRDKSKMPPRSRVGNTITCAVLGMLSGLWIGDTQTGLRGLPAEMIGEYAELEGDRYEFEMNMLLSTRKTHTPVEQVVIDTIYIDDNKSSHFDTFKDSVRIYALMLRQVVAYIGSSLFSGVIDLGLFTLLHYSLPGYMETIDFSSPVARDIFMTLLPSGVGVPLLIARAVSSFINYRVNRDIVFKTGRSRGTLVAYYALVVVAMMLSIQIIRLLTAIGVPTVLAKVVADFLMFLMSFNVQHKLIFRAGPTK